MNRVNAILIRNKHDRGVVKQVENFSFDNVAKALASMLDTTPDNVAQLVANVNGGVYALKHYEMSSYHLLQDVEKQPISDVRYGKTFSVEYVEIDL